MIEIRPVKNIQKKLLRNIFQKYLYEMSSFYDDKMDLAGNYTYEYFDDYFRKQGKKQGRKAFFIYGGRESNGGNNDNGDNSGYDGNSVYKAKGKKELLGFVMINKHSYTAQKTDYVLAEFTVFPIYRKKHIATCTIKQIFKMFRGNWQIKYSQKNKVAKLFWQKTTAKFKPKMTNLDTSQTMLSFNVT